MEESQRRFVEEVINQGMTRRQVLKRAAALGLTPPIIAALLAACGDDDDDTAAVADDTAADDVEVEDDSAEDDVSGDDGDDEEDADDSADDAAEDPDDGEEEVWNVVISEDTGGGDPLSEYPGLSQWWLQWHVMEPLFYPALAEDGQSWVMVNELASDWRFEDEGRQLVVELQEGIYFHNGEELTAEHVKRIFDETVATDPPIRRTTAIAALGEAEVIDDYTIQWTMPQADMSVLGAVFQLLIPPMERYDMSAEDFEAQPIGTGPYRVVSWPVDGTVELEAWDEYRRGKARPDRLVIRYIPDTSTRVFELISGNAQLAMGLTVDAIADIANDDDYEIAALKGSTFIAEVINQYKSDPPLNDRRVRQAMNYAIDRDAIIEAIMEGQASSYPGPLGPGLLGFREGHEPYPYDPDRARELLEEAGVSDITLDWYVPTGGGYKIGEVAEVVANQLGEVGININLLQVESSRLLAARNEGEHDIVSLTFPISWVPTNLLRFTLFNSLPDEVSIPVWGDTPEQVVQAREMYADANATESVEEMEERLAELHEFMHEEAFWLYIYSPDAIYGAHTSINYRPFPTVYFRLYDEWSRRGMDVPADTDVPLVFED
jgi:peptide/nickel transport system substrate-binding protein